MIDFAFITLVAAVAWLTGAPQAFWQFWRYGRQAHRQAVAAQQAANRATTEGKQHG